MGDRYPSDADLDGAQDGLAALLGGNTMDGAAAPATELREDLLMHLRRVQANLTAMGDPVATADAITEFNLALDNFTADGESLDRIVVAFNRVNDSLAAFPDQADLDADLTAIETAVGGISVAPIRAALTSLEVLLTAFPSVEPVIAELNKIFVLRDIADCVTDAVEELSKLNDTIVSLPDSINDILDLGSEINETLNDIGDQLANSTDSLRDSESEIKGQNIS